MIRFRVLGSLDLRSAGGEVLSSALRREKGLALLTYLACKHRGSFARRDTLVGLFWPELDQRRARAALRKALHYLRRSLGEDVLIGRGDEEIGLDSAAFWCDAPFFEKAIRQDHLDEALELYRGDLLTGFFLHSCLEFENWLESERTRLRELAAGAAWTLAHRLLNEGGITRAERLGQRALDLVCTDEVQVQRFVMALHAAGDRAAAFRFLERFQARLKEDLGLSPSAETVAIAEQLQEDQGEIASGSETTAGGGLGLGPGPLTGPPPVSFRPDSQTASEKDGLVVAARPDWTRRGSRRRWLGPVVLAGLAGGVALGITAIGMHPGGPSPSSPVAVLPMVNRTGDPSLDVHGITAADWITEALGQAELGRPVPLSEILSPSEWTEGGSDAWEELRESWPDRTGAKLAAVGYYYLLGDSLFFDVKIVDAHGRVLETVPPIGGPRAEIAGTLNRLRFASLARLERILAPDQFQLMWPEGNAPLNLEGHEALYEAALVFGTEGAAAAIPLFERAADLDSTFLAPQRWLVGAYTMAGRPEEADSLCTYLEDRIETVPRQARLVTQMNCAGARGDHASALSKARELVEFSSLYHLRVGHHALAINRSREAVRAFSQYHASRSRTASDWADWNYEGWALALHWLGDHRKELQVAREGRERFPESRALLTRELSALIAMGRVQEALDVVDVGVAQVPMDHSPGTLLDPAARELDEHGYPDIAQELWQRLVDWHETEADVGGEDPELLLQHAEVLLCLERPEEAEAVLLGLPVDQRQSLGALGLMGVTLAHRHRVHAAEEISETLRLWNDPFDHGESDAWRARIAAALEDEAGAVSNLREALREGMSFVDLAPRGSPYLRALRGYPPFEEFLEPGG